MVYVGVWTAAISSARALLSSSSTDHLVQLIVSEVVAGISDTEDIIATIWEDMGICNYVYQYRRQGEPKKISHFLSE